MEIKKFSIYAGLRELIPSSNLPSATSKMCYAQMYGTIAVRMGVDFCYKLFYYFIDVSGNIF